MSAAPAMTSMAVLPAGTATVIGLEPGGSDPCAGVQLRDGNSTEYCTGMSWYRGGQVAI